MSEGETCPSLRKFIPIVWPVAEKSTISEFPATGTFIFEIEYWLKFKLGIFKFPVATGFVGSPKTEAVPETEVETPEELTAKLSASTDALNLESFKS